MSLLDKIAKQKEYDAAHPEEAKKRKEEAEKRKAEEQAKREAERLAEEKHLVEEKAKKKIFKNRRLHFCSKKKVSHRQILQLKRLQEIFTMKKILKKKIEIMTEILFLKKSPATNPMKNPAKNLTKSPVKEK